MVFPDVVSRSSCQVGRALIFFKVFPATLVYLYRIQLLFCFSATMAELQEIPLELQVREANRRIAAHLSKGRKYAEILSPAFLR